MNRNILMRILMRFLIRIVTRLFADQAQLGRPVVIDNMPGAGGMWRASTPGCSASSSRPTGPTS